MPKSLLRYVIAKVELLSGPVQESCACVDATSLVLVLLVTPVIAGEENDLLGLTSCSFSSPVVSSAGVTPPRWTICLLLSPPHFWGN